MKNISIVALIVALTVLGFVSYQYVNGNNKKIGVLQFHELINNYQGMKDATKKYSEKMDRWSRESDSLESGLKNLIQEIKIDSVKRDKKKLERDYKVFLYKRKVYFEFKQKTEEIAAEEDKRMTQGVIHQVNEHVKNFALKNGFDIIISNTEEQNVGYVNEATDVTKKLIEFANESYKGE